MTIISTNQQSSIDNRKLYVSDLDGTLLGADAKLSEFSRATLKQLLDNGANFTIASARAVNEIKPVLGDLPIRLPIIAVNGAYLSDYASGKHLIINSLQSDTAKAIYDTIRGMNLWPFVCTFNGFDDCLYYQHLDHPASQWWCRELVRMNDKRLRETTNLAGVFGERVISMAVMGDRDPVGHLSETLLRDLKGQLETFYFENPYSPGYWWLTIHDKKACKSIALRELMEMAGFVKEDLTVFGDHINDIRMFELAGRGVAVANAEPEVKAVADEIIGPNTDDSVVRYIAANTQSANQR